MAVALLGKCLGLLALMVLFYTCCYGFRIRDGGALAPSVEQTQRSACPISGECTDKTTRSTPVLPWRKHETTLPRATGRKPPVGTAPADGDADRDKRIFHKVQKIEEDDSDEDDVTVVSENLLASDEDEVSVVSEVEKDEDEESEDEDEDEESEDEDDEDDGEDEEASKFMSVIKKRNEEDQKKDEVVRLLRKDTKFTKIDRGTKHAKDEKEREEVQDRKDIKMQKKTIEREEEQDRKDIKMQKKTTIKDLRKSEHVTLVKQGEKVSTLRKDDDDNDDNDDDDDDDDGDDDDENDEEDEDGDVDEDEAEDRDEDADEDEDEDEDKDEDEEEDEESEEQISTPPPKKLEKVRLADKEKFKSIEGIKTPLRTEREEKKPITEKARYEAKEEKEEVKKPRDEPAKSKVEPVKKQKDETAKPKEEAKMQVEKAEAKRPTKIEEIAKPKGKAEEVIVKPNEKAEEVTVKPKGKTEEVTVKSKGKAEDGITKPKGKAEEIVKPKGKAEDTAKLKAKVEEGPKSPVKNVSKPELKDKQEQVKTTEKEKVKKPESKRKPEVKKITKGDLTKESKHTKPKPKPKKHAEATMSLAELNDALLHVPTFVPNFTAVENPNCQQQGKIFLRQLRGYKLWALQMLDSSAKIPSGLLRGNVNQFGDFDQCLGVIAHVKVNEQTIKIQGKYCLATVDLYASDPNMKFPVNLMQARAFIKGNMRDPSHFIPRFTTVNWALCLPATCSAKDAVTTLEDALSQYNATSGIRFTVDVDPNMCYVRQKSKSYSKETVGVLYFYATIICLVIVATVRDYWVAPTGKGNYSERIIMSFSLRRTVKALLKYEPNSPGDIMCIHGIRVISTVALYIAHQLIPISRLPFANRVTLTEVANHPLSTILRGSLVYTDSFLLLSGVLTAYNMARELTKRGEIRWFCRFIARFIRLTPALLVIIFWYAFVMEHVGSGPQWNNIISANAELCKKNAWTNLLYVQNFFPFEEMCATHTHQLALDMQLSLLAPILVFFLHCKPIIGIILIFFIVQVSATVRYFATANNNLSLVIFHGMSLRHLYKTANLTYALPLHRATPYVLGVALGYLLHYTGNNVKIHKIFVILGWLIAMALGSWSLFSPWQLAKRDYVYDVEEASQYAVISPVLWALALCWIIFACFTDHGGMVNRFLSNYWLVLFSKISYAVYLTQFAVFFYNVGTTRYSSDFQVHRAIDLLEAIIVIVISIVLTLLFDLPMQEVKSVIMESTDLSAVPVEKPVEEKEETKDESKQSKNEKEKQEKAFEEDEVASTGWDWQRDISGTAPQRDKEEDDEEPTIVPTLKKPEGRRKSFIAQDSYETEENRSWDWIKAPSKRFSRDDEEYMDRGERRSRSSYRTYSNDSEEEFVELLRIQQLREEELKRSRRSLSRSLRERSVARDEEDARQYAGRRSESRGRSKEPEDYKSWEFIAKERSSSRGPDSKKYLERPESPAKLSRSPPSKFLETRRPLSSESEEEPPRRAPERRPSVEPKIASDEEEWEQELKIRRKQFMEKLAMQKRESTEEEHEATPKRRSSAEGRIALLKDPSGNDSMDSWTVTVVPAISQLGSSQEPSEPEEDSSHHKPRDYRENAPPSRDETEEESSSRQQSYTSDSQKTSLEEEEDTSTFNFVLTKNSKKISLQDLSRLSQEESDLADSGWNVVKKEGSESVPKVSSSGLYKRESIIKSQASEEDPEYFVPERPKLVQQEREHPFKKAWQMQKSRSEEDYIVKDPAHPTEHKKKDEEPSIIDPKRALTGEKSEDLGSLADDEGENITTWQNSRPASKSESEETDSTSVSQEKSIAAEDTKSRPSSKSETDEDSLAVHWPTDNDQEKQTGSRSKSEETNWDFSQEET